MKSLLFKVQRSFGDEMALVYNKSRRYLIEVPLTDDIREFMGDDMKVYAKGFIDANKMINLYERVAEQDW